MEKEYDVVIVGGSITGAALLYVLSKYTDIKNIALYEKYGELAVLNSNAKSNSQTIHCGDIETNYTIEKATKVKRTSDMIKNYGINHNLIGKAIFKGQKMAMGVGKEEVEFIKQRFEEFKSLYKHIKFYTKEEVKKIEPLVIKGVDGNDRPEDIVAMGSDNDFTTADYGLIAKDMVKNAQEVKDKNIEVTLNTKVGEIKDDGEYKLVDLGNGTKVKARYVAVCAGAHSLLFAHNYGLGLNFSCFPVAGSFYKSVEKSLNGKVYMKQNPKLPFAALHGDPDITLGGNCRFGPTALVIPKLERFRKGTYLDFWKSFRISFPTIKVLLGLLKDKDIRNYLIRNYMFEVPFLGKRLFVKDARKIVPTLKDKDITYAKKYGGVRPQIIDKDKKELLLGEARLQGNGVLFNMTPSPGATSSLGNAERDTAEITKYLNAKFNVEEFKADYEKEVDYSVK